MKNWIVFVVMTLMSIAEVQAADCTDKLMLSVPAGSTIVKLGPVTAQKIFAAAKSAQLGGTMDLATSMWTNTFQSEKMICCKFSSARALIVDSERCQIAVDEDGSLSNIEAFIQK